MELYPARFDVQGIEHPGSPKTARHVQDDGEDDHLVALRLRSKQQHWRSHPWSHVTFVVTQRVTGYLASSASIGPAGAAVQDHHGARSPDSSAASTGLGQLSAPAVTGLWHPLRSTDEPRVRAEPHHGL